jgi:hypothetical protein
MRNDTPIRRRPDGSIDTGVYLARARAIRSAAAHTAVRRAATGVRRVLTGIVDALRPLALERRKGRATGPMPR